MKILLASHAFSPSIGGIETCSLDLALAFSKQGHEVRVLTQTPSKSSDDDHGLHVVRRPDKKTLFAALRWCDVFFQNNVGLQTAWPLIFIRKPWIVCTATWVRRSDGSTGLYNKLKKMALRFATNIYISRAVRDHVGGPGHMIPNPYNWRTFHVIPGIERKRSLVFLGRLVSDKGCDVLIKSLAILRDAGVNLPLTIIGTGPERDALEKMAATEKLGDGVRFVGALKGDALAAELNRHEIMVIPSRWEEPFGIVALEGMACGCRVVGSAGGGLPDAIGPGGVLFKNGDAADLARAIRTVWENPESATGSGKAVARHLERHRAETIATGYLEIFENLRPKR